MNLAYLLFIVVPTESSTPSSSTPIEQFLKSIAGTKKGTVRVNTNYTLISSFREQSCFWSMKVCLRLVNAASQ
jgi:hypothetical protein